MAKTALIVCNGEPPSLELLRTLWSQVDLRVCADGGANFVVSQGYLPDFVVGDMDSLLPAVQQKLGAPQLVKISEQATNDGDKALRYCLEQHIEKVYLLGAAGRRNDQFLSNLELLDKYAPKLKIVLWTPLERIELIEKDWQEMPTVGSTLSLLPFFGAAHGITTSGLKYPLHNDSLEWGQAPSGLSNITTAPSVRVSVQQGKLLLILQISN